MSLVEAVANVAVGYGVAVATQIVVFPWFGIQIDLAGQLGIGAIFTVVSIVRSFALRRVFEAIRVPRDRKEGRRPLMQAAGLAGSDQISARWRG